MTFIDLFAGLGGFHQALTELGHDCVFACDTDKQLNLLYEKNFGLKPVLDIRQIPLNQIPKHDILCAGFPCQPFSKAGDQQGFNCPRNGDLFDYVIKIIRYHKPNYLLLENVANIQTHDNGNTWNQIKKELIAAGYSIDSKKLSPHRFGIPQIRERLFIIGSKKGLNNFKWPIETVNQPLSINSILDKKPKEARKLSPQVVKCLEIWQEFLNLIPATEKIPSPLWSMEFGANYPYESATPYSIGTSSLKKYLGSHGIDLNKYSNDQIMNALPAYARVEQESFPKWKIDFIRQNRNFYEKNKKYIKKWQVKIKQMPPSLQKLEWNCVDGKRDIWKYLIQFRASGVRVKRPTTSPALVSMTATQVPIIAWEKRYMTPKECSRLQSMDTLPNLPNNQTKAFKALGNAVNVNIVRNVAKALIENDLNFDKKSSQVPINLILNR
jgi:DNA (cytosine-5)-methyltransferase 1